SDYDGFPGMYLVLDQRGNAEEHREWHLHQDLTLTLRLKREGDIWVSIDEGYIEVAKLERNDDGSPRLLSVRASHLKDYLCARRTGGPGTEQPHRPRRQDTRDRVLHHRRRGQAGDERHAGGRGPVALVPPGGRDRARAPAGRLHGLVHEGHRVRGVRSRVRGA